MSKTRSEIIKRHPREYGTWCHIKDRCYRPKTCNYALYGGSGIKMCDTWLNSFESFLKDMGSKPNKGIQIHIHRIDPLGNYEPKNCIWISSDEHKRLPRLHPKHQKLTPRQNTIFQFIASSKYIPTYREIAEHFGMSIPAAYEAVLVLEKKGKIKRDPYKARSIFVVEEETT